jgi:hypothetical protein
MTTTTHTTYVVRALPAALLDEVRSTEVDASDTPAERVVATGGEPLRCCLRDAGASEALLLFGYRPPTPQGPYQEMGAVFAHADRCEGYTVDGYPSDWLERPQVLRAYDDRGWIHPATTVHDGTDPEAALATVLAAPGVVEVHSRNIAYGCYMFAVTPPR